MLVSEKLLFLHVPKAAGTSITSYLARVLPKPIWWYGATDDDVQWAGEGITALPWPGYHVSLDEADSMVHQLGLSLTEFPVVLIPVRNPYEWEVSLYSYWHRADAVSVGFDALQTNIRRAQTDDFEDFSLYRSPLPVPGGEIEGYYLYRGNVLPNARIVRVERLADELPGILGEIGIRADEDIPYLRASSHRDWSTYYTRAAERAVYRRYKWIFDRGFYERVDAATFPFVTEPPFNGESIPLSGRMRQISPVVGWSNGWIGPRMVVKVRVDVPIAALAIEGFCPTDCQPGVEVELAVSDRRASEVIAPGAFRLTLPCAYPARSEFDIAMSVSANVLLTRIACVRDVNCLREPTGSPGDTHEKRSGVRQNDVPSNVPRTASARSIDGPTAP